MRRLLAGLVATVCWAGLAIQFLVTFKHAHYFTVTIWTLSRFFTVTTNLLVGIVMTFVALGRRPSASVLAGATLSILLVGSIYWLLLRGLHPLRGPAIAANILLHDISPVLMALWWLLFARGSGLSWRAPLLWAVYPLAYLAFVLARGELDGRYPYPFLNVPEIGWNTAIMNILGIAIAFLLCGFALVWIDHRRPLGRDWSNG